MLSPARARPGACDRFGTRCAPVRSGRLCVTLDRAWRCLPDDAATLAPIYGRLLFLEARDHYAALRLLQRAIDIGPDPDVAALIVLVLLRLERPEDARQRLAAALADYCVVPGGLLAHAAGETVQHPAIEAPGWVGRGAALEFVGELSPLERSSVLEVRLDGRAGYTQPVGEHAARGPAWVPLRGPAAQRQCER